MLRSKDASDGKDTPDDVRLGTAREGFLSPLAQGKLHDAQHV